MHTDGAEHADFPPPFHHRQREGVDDAEDGDDYGEGEQAVEDREEHVDLLRC